MARRRAGNRPRRTRATLAGRAKLCEAIAVHSSVFIERDDLPAAEATLRTIIARDPDVLSAVFRREGGKEVEGGEGPEGAVLLEIGDHIGRWGTLTGQAAAESYVYVPIYANEKKWGRIEVRFHPLSSGGWLGHVNTAPVRMIGFVAAACTAIFMLYLRKMLQHLDPSKVVPSRVRSALDTLAEGLLVMDNDERIVLANQTFASIVGRPPESLLGSHASRLPWAREDGSAYSGTPEKAGRPDAPQYPWQAAIAARRRRRASCCGCGTRRAPCGRSP